MKKLWQNYTTKTICQHCGRQFNVFVHNLKKGFGKYCSKACSNSANLNGFKNGHKGFRKPKTPKKKIGHNEYQRLHRWVRQNLGESKICEHCGKSELTGRKINWASKSRLYKWDLEDWIRLCSKCHHKYDYA